MAHKEELNDADFTCLLVVKEILNNSHLVELDHTADLVDLLGENLPVDVASLVNVHWFVQFKNGVAMSLYTVTNDI